MGQHILRVYKLDLNRIKFDSVDTRNSRYLYTLDRVDKLKYAYVRSVSFDGCWEAYIRTFCLDRKRMESVQPFCWDRARIEADIHIYLIEYAC